VQRYFSFNRQHQALSKRLSFAPPHLGDLAALNVRHGFGSVGRRGFARRAFVVCGGVAECDS
jgi:hypothetical protein